MSQKGKKNSINYDNIDGGLVKDHGSSDLGFKPHISTQVHSQMYTTDLTEVPPFG